jgi:dienelactone hydrolase
LKEGKRVTLQNIPYRHGETELNGLLALPAGNGKRPGVLVIHAADGITDGHRERLGMFAALGYVTFGADLYGGKHPKIGREEMGAAMFPLVKDNGVFRARIRAGLDALRARPEVDATRIAAVGYCLGGKAVLELARDGADVRGVVSYHGLLNTPQPAARGAVKARVLVCNGARDPYVKAADIAAFQDEMDAAGADWQLINYGHAAHAFAILGEMTLDEPGIAYDASADRQSWAATQAFFAEIF